MMTKRSNHMPMLMKIDTMKRIDDAGARLLEPENLRREHVARDHRPVGPPVGAEGAIDERELLVGVPAEPRDEELHRVGVADDRAGHEHDPRHAVEVEEGDDVLEAEGLARDHHQRDHHREAREDGAGDEVGREDRRVPAGQLRDGEVHRDDRVHGEDERCRQAGEDQVRRLVVQPVARRAAPAEREEAVDVAPNRGDRAVAQRGEVGDQADVPEERGDRAVGGDREEVPEERAPEPRPRAHLVRERRHPVREPGTADVNAGEEAARTSTAKIVMASAARLIDVRHFCRKRKSTAEISVPACPMPIQKTKLVMSKAQPTGWFKPQMPMPSHTSQPTARPRRPSMPIEGRKKNHHASGVVRSTGVETASVMEWKSWPPRISGARPATGS